MIPVTRHPEGFRCPICWSELIYWWPEVENWSNMTDAEKSKFGNCAVCGYRDEDGEDEDTPEDEKEDE